MGSIHSLPDGTKLAIWEERNQVMALALPFRRGAGATVLVRDVLKDLTSTLFRGSVYYACHSLEHRILFGVAGDGQPAAVLSDPSDGRHYSGLKLLEWKEELYLFFRARSQTGKFWELKAMRPISDREARTLWEGFSEPVKPVYAAFGEKLFVLAEGRICIWDGKRQPEQGEILKLGTGKKARDAILHLEEERKKYKMQAGVLSQKHETQLGEIKKQYDELAAYATELQQEGKRWRERYYKKH